VSLFATVVGLVLAGILLIRFYPYTLNFTTFPRVSQTASGVAGDPINLILVGSQAQITRSFERAGWLIPDPITPQTTAKIIVDSLAHRSYPKAPVSNLYAFGHAQNLAFEKPTNDVQNRGHARFWKTTATIGGEPVWVGQASYDSGIELSGSTHFPTHHIRPTVDLERASVGADLQATGLVRAEGEVAYTAPIFAARNGGGDYYESDGNVLVINYTLVPLRLSPQPFLIGGLKAGAFVLYDVLLTLPTNSGTLVALIIIVVIAVVVIAGIMLWRSSRRQQATTKHRRSQPT
jgi:hypothetical protein